MLAFAMCTAMCTAGRGIVGSRESRQAAIPWLSLVSVCPKCIAPRRWGQPIHEPRHILAPLFTKLMLNKTAGVFVDVGPSVDMSDGEIALKFGFKVIAIEARKKTHEKLLQRYNETVATGQLTILHNAVTEDGSGATLHIYSAGDASSLSRSAVPAKHVGNESVTTSSLDAIVQDEPCAVIKLDIQGFEYEALKGAREILARPAHRAPVVIVEVCERLRPEVPAVLVLHWLQRFGYDCYDVKSDTGNRMHDGSLRHRHRCCSADASKAAQPEAKAKPAFCEDRLTESCNAMLYTDFVCIKSAIRRSNTTNTVKP